MADSLKVLFMAAEMAPYAKTGGVADVARSLPSALRGLGHDVRVAIPRYARIDPARFSLQPLLSGVSVTMEDHREFATVFTSPPDDEVPTYLIDNQRYFARENLYGYPDDGERFIFFCRAAMEALRSLDWKPEVIHLNDWHTAIVANWLKTIYRDDPFFRNVASVYTLHNLAYQGIFGWRILEVAGVDEYAFMYPNIEELPHVVTLMAHGILFADAISTVSPTYARQILTPEYGEKLHTLLNDRKERLRGILNGIDYRQYDPATDRQIYQRYDAGSLGRKVANKKAFQREANLEVAEEIPLIGCISRLTNQKGFDILAEVVDGLLELPVQLAIVGTGDQYYHDLFSRLGRRYPGKVAVYLTFNDSLSRKLYAASDIYLMPSRFEPSGTGQMVAMRYGTIPVVHQTGGLADSVTDYDPRTGAGTGFAFRGYSGMQLFASVVRALESYKYPEVWRRLSQSAMGRDFSWEASAQEYQELYRDAMAFQNSTQLPARVG